MESKQKKHKYQLFIDHIVETHGLNGGDTEYKEKEFVCHLDVDKILSNLHKEYLRKQDLVRQGIKHNIHQNRRYNNAGLTVGMPKRESLIMNPLQNSHKNSISNSLLSIFL